MINYNLGIMGAMEEEVLLIKNAMEITDEKKIADRIYYSGRLHDTNITLVFSRWGKVASASTATTLINTFGANFILFTGVAGAVDKTLNIGDIVIGESLYQHDMDARPIFPKFQIPLTENKLFKPRKEDIEKISAASNNFISNINNEIDKNTLIKFSVFKPKVCIGTIASGDQFVSNAATHENLKIESEKVLAVEMEGAAVAQVCQEHQVPYIVIRTISDKADHSASVDFKAFVKEVASHYSSGIVGKFLGK